MKKENAVPEKKYCPTQSGVVFGYRVFYLEIDGKWKEVPWHSVENKLGIPYPRGEGGILATIGMFGYSQAKAIAYWHKAKVHSVVGLDDEKVKIVEYQVSFDINAEEKEFEIV